MLQDFVAWEHLKDMIELGKIPKETTMFSHMQEKNEVFKITKVPTPIIKWRKSRKKSAVRKSEQVEQDVEEVEDVVDE